MLGRYPGLRVKPQTNGSLLLVGDFDFHARFRDSEIIDSYLIEIEVPDGFPFELPRVREVGGRIPADFHRYQDGSLCLGSPIRLRLHAGAKQDLASFAEKCILPYLYGFSYKEQYGAPPFGELEHGHDGIIQDLKSILNFRDEKTCVDLLRLAGLERRKANRHPCPCGSGLRVGRCHNRILNPFRTRFGRLWCRNLHEVLREHRLLEKRQNLVQLEKGYTKVRR